MKQVIKCPGCNKLTGLNGGRSFAVEINEFMKDSTGKTVMVRTRARICSNCSVEAGYAPRAPRAPRKVKPVEVEPTPVEPVEREDESDA